MARSMINNMTEGNIPRQLITFSLPLLLANLLQALYTTVDALVIGNYVGTSALSAVTNCGELVNFYAMLAMGFSSAGQIIIAQFVGSRDRDAIKSTIGSFLSFLTLLSIGLSVLCFASVDWQLRLINLPGEALADGHRYMMICGAGLVFVFLYNAVSGILRGMGDSKRPLIFVAVASLSNLVLDLVFVIGLKWGAAGAALATTMGQGISVITSLVYLYRHRESFGFDFKLRSFIPVKKYLLMFLRLGIPMAAQFGAIMISVLFIGARINLYGVEVSAANGIANKLENIIRIVSNSVSTAGSAMVAQNIAAKKFDRVTRILGCVLAICLSWVILCALIISLLPDRIFGFFDDDPVILQYAWIFAPAGVVAYLGNGIRAACNSLINGIGFASLSLVTGLLDSVAARIGFSLLLAYTLGMGILGFWMGSALAGWVPVIIGLVYYLSGRWKTHRLITQDRG